MYLDCQEPSWKSIPFSWESRTRDLLQKNGGTPWPRLFQCLLLSFGAVPVDPAAFMETVTHHALAKQKEDDRQDDHNEELSNSERGWLRFWRACRIQISCHRSYVSAGAGMYRGTPILWSVISRLAVQTVSLLATRQLFNSYDQAGVRSEPDLT